MSITAPPLSAPCDRDDCGACFPDEPSDCGCECHGIEAVRRAGLAAWDKHHGGTP